MAQNNSKDRKSQSQEIFEEADNAGRFEGSDADAKAASTQARENINMDSQSNRKERNKEDADDDSTQSQDRKGEAEKVNDDTGRPLNKEEADKARNKANEGLRQGRNEG